MKNPGYILAIALLFISMSCNKSTDGNKGVIIAEKGKTDQVSSASKEINGGENANNEYTHRYVAEDGSSALVTFKNSKEGNTISVMSNKKTITIPQKDSDGTVTVYEKDGIIIKSENNLVTISQGNNVISLKKARGQ